MATDKFRIETLPAARIVADEKNQHRIEGTDPQWVDELAGVLAAGGTFRDRPVVYEDETTHELFLACGFHRHGAALKHGKPIEWEVRPGGAYAAFRHSLGTNAQHGRRRKNGDLRAAVEAALAHPRMVAECSDARGVLSARKLAAVLLCDSSYCADLVRESTGAAKDPKKVAAANAANANRKPSAGKPQAQPQGEGDGRRGEGDAVGGSGDADERRHRDGEVDGGGGGGDADRGTGRPAGERDPVGGGAARASANGDVARDRLGRQLPAHLIPVFRQAEAITAQVAALRAVEREVVRLDRRADVGGFLAADPALVKRLAGLRVRLSAALAWCVCPGCTGGGESGRCPTCGGPGWLTQGMFVRLPGRLQEEACSHAPGDAWEVDAADALPASAVSGLAFAPPGPNLDALGQTVPTALRDAFAGDQWMTAAADDLEATAQDLQDASGWNPHIPSAAWEGVRQAAADVRGSRPYAVCVRCKGKGCDQCMTKGFLPAWMEYELAAGN